MKNLFFSLLRFWLLYLLTFKVPNCFSSQVEKHRNPSGLLSKKCWAFHPCFDFWLRTAAGGVGERGGTCRRFVWRRETFAACWDLYSQSIPSYQPQNCVIVCLFVWMCEFRQIKKIWEDCVCACMYVTLWYNFIIQKKYFFWASMVSYVTFCWCETEISFYHGVLLTLTILWHIYA